MKPVRLTSAQAPVLILCGFDDDDDDDDDGLVLHVSWKWPFAA